MHAVTKKQPRTLCIRGVSYGFRSKGAQKEGLCTSFEHEESEAAAFLRQCENPERGGASIIKVGTMLCGKVDSRTWVLPRYYIFNDLDPRDV